MAPQGSNRLTFKIVKKPVKKGPGRPSDRTEYKEYKEQKYKEVIEEIEFKKPLSSPSVDIFKIPGLKKAISLHQPNSKVSRPIDCIFNLARSAMDLGKSAEWKKLESKPIDVNYLYFYEWFKIANDNGKLDQPEKHYYDRFLQARIDATIPWSIDIVTVAYQQALANRDSKLAERLERKGVKGPMLLLLATWCLELSKLANMKNGVFYISMPQIERIMGLANRPVAQGYLRKLEDAGVIKTHEKGNTRRSTRYTFISSEPYRTPLLLVRRSK